MTEAPKGPPKIDIQEILSGGSSDGMQEIDDVEIVIDPAEAESGDEAAAPPQPREVPAPPAGPPPAPDDDGLEERHLRLRADFENFRRRVTKEREEYRVRAAGDLVPELLPVLDNLDRAFEGPGPAGENVFREGIDLIRKQFREVLLAAGLEPIDALGQPFDPEVHEAVSRVATDEFPENAVAEEVQKGYRFGGRLLRPAMVVVASAPGGETQGAGGPPETSS